MKHFAATLAGGIAGSFAMDAVQAGFAAIFERGRAPEDLDEEVEAIAALVKLLGRWTGGELSQRRSVIAGHVVHYVFGIVFAAGYAHARARSRSVAYGGGSVVGTVLWIVSDRIVIPALKLGRSWDRYSRSERTNALLSHLAYAVSLEFVLRRFARANES